MSIVGLFHRSLGTCQEVTGLSVVHLCDELSMTHGLALAHEQTLHHAHARKADSCTLALLDDAYIGDAVISHRWRNHQGLHSDGSLFPILFLLTAAADDDDCCQH